ncbi:coenzyme PQQ biosynthesis protein A [Methylobacillus flagellatus KT]|uniref:Coenzyme PQQ synthesis protein A n=3 Tax=Methylophilaceae TaxID=32011 RepID=Q1GX88_METFK|nr:coenzyme PQQ biosynthesis protein A [Methylobacillus flagellatus KT]
MSKLGLYDGNHGLRGTDCAASTHLKRRLIMWTKPEVTEMRFGFEVTMYVCNR